MAGEAQSQEFQIGSATVMVGDVGELWQLHPETHSLGLVKNFTIKTDMKFATVNNPQGGKPIYSEMTENNVTATVDVYEASSRNLLIGIGKSAQNIEKNSDSYPLTVTLAGSTSATLLSAIDVSAQFKVGTWVMIQENGSDMVHVAQLTQQAVANGSRIFLEFDNHPTPAGTNFSLLATVVQVKTVSLNNVKPPDYFSVKVIGESTKTSSTIGMIFPRVRITSGLDFTFDAANFSKIKFDFQAQSCRTTDAAYPYFPNDSVVKMFMHKQHLPPIDYNLSQPMPANVATRASGRILVRSSRNLGVFI